MMPDSADQAYSEIMGARQLRTQSRVSEGMEGNPDKAARAIQIGQETNTNPVDTYHDLDSVDQAYKGILANEVVNRNSVLQQYVNSNRLHSTVSNDDWHNLDAYTRVMDKWPSHLPGWLGGETATQVLKTTGQRIISIPYGASKGAERDVMYIWDALKSSVMDIYRAPGVISGMEDPPELIPEKLQPYLGSMKHLKEYTEQHLRDAGVSESGVKAALYAESLVHRYVAVGQMTMPLIVAAAGGPLAGILAAMAPGLIRAEISEPIEKMTGFPAEATEGLLMGAGIIAGVAPKFMPGYMTPLERMRYRQQLDRIGEMVRATEYRVKSGQAPHPGMDEIANAILARASKDAMEVHDEAIRAALQSITKQRSPDSFARLAELQVNDSMYVDSDAVRRIYGNNDPMPGDGILGNVPGLIDEFRNAEYTGGFIPIKYSDWLNLVDDALKQQLHDHVKPTRELLTIDQANKIEARELADQQRFETLKQEHDQLSQQLKTETDPQKIAEMSARIAELEDQYRPKPRAEIRMHDRMYNVYVDGVLDNSWPTTADAQRYIAQQGWEFGGTHEDLVKRAAGIDQIEPVLEQPGMDAKELFVGQRKLGLPQKLYDRWQRLMQKSYTARQHRERREAREDVERKQESWWRDKWVEERQNVWEEMGRLPEYQMYRYFNEGFLYGDKIPDEMRKIDPKYLTEDERKAIPAKWQKKGGMNPDDIAGEFEFNSGREFIQAMVNIEKLRAGEGPKAFWERYANRTTDGVMEAKYGKLASRIDAELTDHATGLTEMEKMEQGLLGMALRAGIPEEGLPISREQQQIMVQQEFSQYVKWDRRLVDKYMRDMGKAWQNVIEAASKGDWVTAFKHMQQQYNAMLYVQEAKRFNKTIDKYDRNTDILLRRGLDRLAETLPGAHIDHLHDILTRTGHVVRRTMDNINSSLAQRGEDATLEKFWQRRERAGLPRDQALDETERMPSMIVYPELFNKSWNKDIKTMNVWEAKSVMDTIQSIMEHGRNESKLFVREKALNLAEAKGEMIDDLSKFKERKIVRDALGKVKESPFLSKLVGLKSIEWIFDRWAHDNPDSAFHRYLLNPIIEANYNWRRLTDRVYAPRISALAKYGTDLKESIPNSIFYEPQQLVRDKQTGKMMPDLGNAKYRTMTRANLRAVMLNLGTPSNLEKLLRGYGIDYTQANIRMVENWVERHATAEDWSYVKDVWDIFKDIQKESDAMTMRMNGTIIDKIPTRVIDSPSQGRIQGAYYPMIYEDHPVNRGIRDDIGEFHNIKQPRTAQGFEKERTGFFGPVALDIDGMTTHIARRLRDIAFREVIREASKIMLDSDFQQAVTRYQGPEFAGLFERYLRDMAGQPGINSRAYNSLNRFLDILRQRVVSAAIAYRPSVPLKHAPTAISHGITEVGLENYVRALGQIAYSDRYTIMGNHDWIMEHSGELQQRNKMWYESLAGAQEEVEGTPRWRDLLTRRWGAMDLISTANKLNMRTGAMVVSKTDLMSAKVVWLAKYTQEMDRMKAGIWTYEEAQKEASMLADRAVRRAHGSTLLATRPEFMRRNDALWRSMTSLYTFFNATLGRGYRIMWKTQDMLHDSENNLRAPTLKEVTDVSKDVTSFFLIPALIEGAVGSLSYAVSPRRKMTWSMWYGMALMHLVGGMIPGFREGIHAMQTGMEPAEGMLGGWARPLTHFGHKVITEPSKVTVGDAARGALSVLALYGLGGFYTADMIGGMIDQMEGRQRPVKDLPTSIEFLMRGTTKPPRH